MTIKFTSSVDGYAVNAVATLGLLPEAAYVARGVATYYALPSDPTNRGVAEDRIARYQLDSSGNVTGLVGPDGDMPGYSRLFNPTHAGTLLTDWSSSLGTLSLISSNGGGEAVALDSTVTCDGLPMVKCTMGNTGTFIADFLFTTPAYLAQMQTLQVPVRVSSNNSVFNGANPAQIWLWDDSTGTRQWRMNPVLDMSKARPGVTTTISVVAGTSTSGWSFAGTSAPTNTSDLDAYTVYRMRIVIAVPGSVAGEAIWFGPVRANGRRKPVVTICLDGQYSSQHNYILPMMEAQGLPASLAIQGTGIGGSGRMTTAQLSRAYAWGHEIIHHTYDGTKGNGYQDSGQWADAAAITADINANSALMTANGWTRGIGYAVHGGSTHPFTGSVSAARQAIVAAGYSAAGTKAIRTGNGIGGSQYLRQQSLARGSNVDAYSVHGDIQWTSTHAAADLTAVVTRAKLRGEWGIITGHRSVVSSAGSLEILNSDFLTFIQALGTDVRSGVVDVMTFGDACRFYGLTTA